MRDTVFLPIGLIRNANNEGWLRSLAYFVRMKALYKNNTHYNFSLRSLATRLKCSPACLRVHLCTLQEKGVITYHSKNITFLGLKKLQRLRGSRTTGIPVNNEIFLFLRGLVIKMNLQRQAYMQKRYGVTKSHTGYIPATKTESRDSGYIGLSCAGFGKEFGLSKTSGQRLRRKMIDRGFLARYRRYSRLRRNYTLYQLREDKIAGRIKPWAFFINGDVLMERRSELVYIFNPYTPIPPTSVMTQK